MRKIRFYFEGNDDRAFFIKMFPDIEGYFQTTYERSFNRKTMMYSDRISGKNTTAPVTTDDDSLLGLYGKGGIRKVFKKCSKDPYSIGIVDFDDGYFHAKTDTGYKSYSLLKNKNGYDYDSDFKNPKIVYSDARDLETTIIRKNDTVLRDMIVHCSSRRLSPNEIKQYEDQTVDCLFKLDLVRKVEQDPTFKTDFNSIVGSKDDNAIAHFFSFSGKINADGHLDISQCFGTPGTFSVRKWVRCSLKHIENEINKTPTECEDDLVSRIYSNYGRGDKCIVPGVICQKTSLPPSSVINKSKIFRQFSGWEEPLIFEFIRGHDIQPVMKAIMGSDYLERDDFTTTLVSKCSANTLSGTRFENSVKERINSIVDTDIEAYYTSLHLYEE